VLIEQSLHLRPGLDNILQGRYWKRELALAGGAHADGGRGADPFDDSQNAFGHGEYDIGFAAPDLMG
jgi:hypothetical protein